MCRTCRSPRGQAAVRAACRPFRSEKLRIQPTLSAGSPFSMRLSAIAGCQFGKPLKSRTRAQTLAAGAPMTLET